LTHRSDEQLLAAYQAGDQQAFAGLIRRYEKELYNFLLRFLGQPSLAEDIFQETFLQVHLSADTFETHRRFRPWLFTIAANKARDLLRSRARRPTVQLTGAPDDEDGGGSLWDNLLRDEATPDKLFDQVQEQERVRQVVAMLPDHLREILMMAYFNQLSYKEMAQILDIPLGTVKSRLHAAVAAFSRKYREHLPDAAP
jgi:RNA polymerase sigma-70 factor (ECF subfamily)